MRSGRHGLHSQGRYAWMFLVAATVLFAGCVSSIEPSGEAGLSSAGVDSPAAPIAPEDVMEGNAGGDPTSDAYYELSFRPSTWDTKHVTIVIIPPAHGPIASTEEGVLPYGVEGAGPMGAYIQATVHVLDDWGYAFE